MTSSSPVEEEKREYDSAEGLNTSMNTVMGDEVLKKMEQDNATTFHQIQELIRTRLGRQRDQIVQKHVSLQKMYEMASKEPVVLSKQPQKRREKPSVSSPSPEEIAKIREKQTPKALPEKKEVSTRALSGELIKNGLQCHGYHPFLLRHTFLRLELPSLSLNNIDLLINYQNVMYLNVADNSINDLSVLSHFPSLLQLKACDNELTECLDFSPPHCKREKAWSSGHIALGSILVNADVSRNHIRSLGCLSKHPFLECLLARDNCVRDISGLSSLQFLQVLDLSNNDINAISGLDNLPIRELSLEGNNLLTLHGLCKLEQLSYLNVARNNITCLAPLSHCAQLTYLDAQYNDIRIIRQVEFLKDLEWLRSIVLLGNPASLIPFYRYKVIHIVPLLQMLDRTTVSIEEKIKSANMFHDEFSDIDHRRIVFEKYFPGENFRDFGPTLVDDECHLELVDIKEADDKLGAMLQH